MRMLPKPDARQVATATAATGMPAAPRITGLTTTMYAIVTKVVSPATTSVRSEVPWPLRSKRRSSMPPSELHAELPADDAWVVDESGGVLEVDAAGVADLVGAVAAERRELVLLVGPGVADARAQLEGRRADEFRLLIEEEVHLGAEGHVGEEVQLAPRAHRDTVAQRQIAHPLRRLRQWIAVDQREAVGVERVELGAGGAAGDEAPVEAPGHREGRILDLGIVVAAAHVQEQVGQQVRLEVELRASADRVFGVDQSHDVRLAADGGELLMADVEVVDVEGHACAMLEHIGLDAHFIGDVVLGAGSLRRQSGVAVC